MKTGPKPRPVEERFWPKVDQSAGPDGCWPWTAATNGVGYGRIVVTTSPARQAELAHRLSYRLAHGDQPIPEGMHVCHACDNPPCVNPTHLFLGTQSDNVRDMVAKGRHASQAKTHCKNGHEFTPENTIRKRGSAGRPVRRCAICVDAGERRRRAIRSQDAALG